MLSYSRFTKRMIAAAAAAVVLVAAFSFNAFAAQVKPADIIENRNYVWEINEEGKMTCFEPSGAPVSGWVRHEDDIYYMDKDGITRTGWIKDEGKWYYCYDEDYIAEHDLTGEVKPGTMAMDTTIDNYKVNSDGEMIKQKW